MPVDEWDHYFINIGFSVPLEDKKKHIRTSILKVHCKMQLINDSKPTNNSYHIC